MVSKATEQTVSGISISYYQRIVEDFFCDLSGTFTTKCKQRSSRLCLNIYFLFHSKLCSSRSMVSSINSPELCFEGIYFCPFLSIIEEGCGTIIFELYRGSPYSGTFTPMLPHVLTWSVISVLNYYVYM